MDAEIMRAICLSFGWLLVLIHCACASSPQQQVQLMSVCDRKLNFSSSSLSILHAPATTSRSCCQVTLTRPSSDFSEQVTINILNMTKTNSPLKTSTQQIDTIDFSDYATSNGTYLKSDILNLPITFNLCRFDTPGFEILITNISKGPCQANQYRCLTTNNNQWCIDEIYHCDGYHSCPQGMDEDGCTKSGSKSTSLKPERTIRGGIVTTIIVFGLLLIIASVSIALVFVYIRRKNQRNRQFTYSLESTSDDWEPTSTGYRLFDNWTNNRRHTENNLDNLNIDANEHMPITTNMTNR